MQRRKIQIKLGEKEYTFSERNKEDVDFNALQDKVRAQKFKFIQENVRDVDNQVALLTLEMRQIYTPEELGQYVFGNKGEQLKMIYDSFKIENPNIKFEEFQQMISAEEINKIACLVNELESDVEATDKKKVQKND